MSVSDARRLKKLETENTRLKKLLVEAMLENEVTREALKKSGEGAGTPRTGGPHGGSRVERTAALRVVGMVPVPTVTGLRRTATRPDESGSSRWRTDTAAMVPA